MIENSKAFLFAENAHKEQKRKHTNEPYIVHPLAVANFVSKYTNDIDIINGALLHDTREDNKNITGEMIEREFGSKTALYVDELTDRFTKEAYPNLNRNQRKNNELIRQKEMSDGSKLIKYADIIDNVPSIVKHDKEFAPKYLQEKKNFLETVKSEKYKEAWIEALKILNEGFKNLKNN